MNIKTLFTVTVLLFPFCIPLNAAPHISGKHIKGEPRDYVHKIPDARVLRSRNLSPSAIQKAIGATGTKKVAVLIVGFPSSGSNTSGSPSIVNQTTIQSNINKMKNFYNEVSYNLLSVSFDVLTTTFTANREMAYYGYPDKADVLIKEIITKAGVTKGSGAGQYDAVMLVHAGYGNESTASTDNGDIWSAHYTFSATNSFTEGLVVAEFESGASPLGVMCHEFGHQLGLPDIYSTDNRAAQSQVGYWELMDMGTWANDGASPSHPGVWCKQLLGWITPSNVTSLSETKLSPVETNADAAKILVPTAADPNREYFLFEYRSKTAGAFDTALPGSGVIIWHIDDSIIYETISDQGSVDTRFNLNVINNYLFTDHRGVSIVPADSTDPSELAGSLQNLGDATDAWPGLKTVFVTPDSDAFNKKPSGIVATGFSLLTAPGKMDFTVSTILTASSLSIEKIINYPNPAGPSYPVSSAKTSGTLTTIACSFSRPPQQIAITIYDVAGEKIRYVTSSDMKFRGDTSGPTKDYNWVYEYDWNGKSDSGGDVADGLYFYRVVADNQLKTGKLAIVR